jgi:hypothetical protein
MTDEPPMVRPIRRLMSGVSPIPSATVDPQERATSRNVSEGRVFA